MKSNYIRVIMVLATVAVLGLFIWWQFFRGSKETGPPPPAAARVVNVDARVLVPSLMTEDVLSTGTLLPDEMVQLQPESAGLVRRIHFTEGAYVRQGQLLLSLDHDDLAAQLQKVQHQTSLARDREYRQRQLLDRGAISREDYDRALTELRTFQADSALLAVRIEKTYLRAPFSGNIGLREVSEGSYVTTQTVIASLVRINPVKVEFSIQERYANRIGVGDTVHFSVETSPETYQAVIYAREPQIETGTRTFRLRAKAPNLDGKLAIGSFARVVVDLASFPDAIMVPNESIIPEMGTQKVFVVRGGKVEPAFIETGIRQSRYTQVISGLSAGDTVVTRGVMQVRPGMGVNIRSLENGKAS